MRKLLPPLLAALCLIVMAASTYWFQQAIVQGTAARLLSGTIGAFGLLLMLVGSALLLNNILTLLGPLTFFAAATFWYIPYEERDALATFGEAYREYCESVRRWV